MIWLAYYQLLLVCSQGAAAYVAVPTTRRHQRHDDDDDSSLVQILPIASKAATTVTALNLELREQERTPDNREVDRLLDTYSEKSRLYRRNYFGASDWARVRRADRFQSNLLTTFQSGLIRQLQMELLALLLASIVVVLYNDVLIEGYVDLDGIQHSGLATFLPTLEFPIVSWTLSSGALGLLLTFRTSVSYSRWNEARTAWGKVINDSRSIARMACVWSKSYKNIDDAALKRLGDATCSFSRSLMNRTLPSQEDETDFVRYTYERIADRNYGEVLRDAKHRPTAALAELTSTMVDFQLNPLHQVEVERVVTGLCDALGACERIFTSPVPTFYTHFTARFLALWLLTLPMGLYEPLNDTWNHWVVIPMSLFIGGLFLGIDELANQMEEPFSLLPMEKMCEGSIRTAVMEQVDRSRMGMQSPFYGEVAQLADANPNAHHHHHHHHHRTAISPAIIPASTIQSSANEVDHPAYSSNDGGNSLHESDAADRLPFSSDLKSAPSAPTTFEEYMKTRNSPVLDAQNGGSRK